MGAARSVSSRRKELVFITTPGYQLRSFVEKQNNVGSQETEFLMKAHHVYFRVKFCLNETAWVTISETFILTKDINQGYW